MAKKNPAPAPEKAEGAAAPAAAKGGPRGPKGVAHDSTIHFLQDKSGKPYNVTDNNPKKNGSAGHARFALYHEGMTVGEALAAGVWSADITWDIDHGFIRVEGAMPSASAPAAEHAEAA